VVTRKDHVSLLYICGISTPGPLVTGPLAISSAVASTLDVATISQIIRTQEGRAFIFGTAVGGEEAFSIQEVRTSDPHFAKI
jgi:hypothetical protein